MSTMIALASAGADPAGPAGRLRGDAPAPPGHPPVPLRPAVLRLLLDALGRPGRRMRPGKRRNAFLSLFGPLSILVLIGALGGRADRSASPCCTGRSARRCTRRTRTAGLGVYLYFSGVTFFTLGFGDVTPVGPLGRCLAVAETGIGFGFLAVVISYLPVLYQAFSRREVTICAARRPRRLAADGRPAARAGSPGTATSPRSTGSWRSGSGGRPRCWRATSRSRS